MTFRKCGIYSLVTILLAGLSNPKLLVSVQAEVDVCDCTDQCTKLVTESKDSLKECNASLSKTEKAKVKALTELEVWESKKSSYASLFAKKEKELATLQKQAKEAKDLSEHYQSELNESENLSNDLKLKLLDLEQDYNVFKDMATKEKNEYTINNDELTRKFLVAEKAVESLSNNVDELENEVNAAQSQLSNAEKENENLAKANTELMKKLENAEKSISSLTQAQDEMKKNYDDARNQIAMSNESNENLMKANSDMLEKFKKSEQSVSTLSQAKEDMVQEISILKDKLKKAESDNKDVNEKLKQSEDVVGSLNKKSEDLSNELKGSEEKLFDLGNAHKALKESLVESETNYNNAQLSIDELESKVSRQQKSYKNKEKKLTTKIEKLEKDLSKVQKESKEYREKHMNAQKEISELEKELEKMHRNAVSSYVNRTLLFDDLSHFVDRHVERAVSAGEMATKKTEDYSAVVKEKLLSVLDKVREQTDPHVGKAREMYSKHAHHHIQSTRDLAQNVYKEHAAKHVDVYVFPMWKSYGEPALTRVLEALESSRLSMVSGLELSSNTVINYLDVSKDEKAPINPLVKRFYNMGSRVNKNAEYIVNRFITVTSVGLGVFFFGSFVFSTVFMVVFFPFYIFKYLFLPSRKKKRQKKIKKEKTSPSTTLADIRQQNGIKAEKIKDERPSQ